MSEGDNSTDNTRVKILFFAKARELAGTKESALTLPANVSSNELKARLVKDFHLESIEDIFILAVNEEFVEPNVELNLSERDEIAVIPPLSGGHKDIVKLEATKLDINNIIESVVAANCGAVSSFIGTTRDNFEQKKVLKLEYEAYNHMALKEMQAVCDKIRSQWNVEHIAIHHRLGEVPVTEASIVIAISSCHRQESLQAVQFAIDAVKTSVPIWKKEIYEDGEPQWKENKECLWAKSDTREDFKDSEIKTESNLSSFDNAHSPVDNVEISIDDICGTVEVECEAPDEIDQNFEIDPDQIQIKADSKELNRRIESFIARKREQVNMVNKQEFGTYSGNVDDENDESTCVCARVNAVLIRRKDSNSHIKVHRVYNQWSHQNTKPAALQKTENETSNYPSALEERLSSTEKILGINKPVPRDVYERMKKIEDRLLFLESISPEYKDLWATDDCDSVKSFDGKDDDEMENNLGTKNNRKRTYSSTELDSKLNEFEDRYGKKAR